MNRTRGTPNTASHDVIHLEMMVEDGIDFASNGDDTIVDLTVYSDMTMNDIHEALVRILKVEESVQSSMRYFCSNSDEAIDLKSTIKSLGIQEGDRIIVDASQKKRKFKHSDFLIDVEDSEEDLTVVCYTRIFEADGVPMKKLKVMVKANQSCGSLIEDVCRIWNRDNLKFRFGRHVLTGEKTFSEVNMTDLGEVLVTGARG